LSYWTRCLILSCLWWCLSWSILWTRGSSSFPRRSHWTLKLLS
jgi:hypothetical protein